MDFCDQYIHYAMQTHRSFQELGDPQCQKSHNAAMKELHRLEYEVLFLSPDKGARLIADLLKHHEERVRISAAAYCLKAEIYPIRSRLVLFCLSKSPTATSYIRAEAAQCIKFCRPYKTVSQSFFER